MSIQVCTERDGAPIQEYKFPEYRHSDRTALAIAHCSIAGRRTCSLVLALVGLRAAPVECTPTWSEATPDGRWRAYSYDEIIARAKASLDIFWLKDESLEDSAKLPEPGIILRDIIEDLQGALEQLKLIGEDVEGEFSHMAGEEN